MELLKNVTVKKLVSFTQSKPFHLTGNISFS